MMVSTHYVRRTIPTCPDPIFANITVHAEICMNCPSHHATEYIGNNMYIHCKIEDDNNAQHATTLRNKLHVSKQTDKEVTMVE